MPTPKTTSSQAPQYRFRGEAPPKTGARASVLNSAIVEGDDSGVATLRILDPIDSWGGDWGVSAKEFAVALGVLPEDVHTIELHLNSPGGEVFEAVAIANMLRQHKARVVAVVDGIAASAASFLAASADETIMAPDTQLMIHDAAGLAWGPASVMRETADVLDKLSDNIAGIYARKAGGDVADWRAAMLAETWYTAEEAVDAGLADKLWTAPAAEDAADAAAAKTAAAAAALGFKYLSREEAPAPPAIADQEAPAARPVPTDEAGDPSALETRRRRMSARQRASKVA